MIDNSITTFHPIPPANFRRFEAITVDPYSRGVRNMATTPSRAAWYASDKVIPSLLAALLALVGIIYLGFKSDIDELKRDVKDGVKQTNEIRVELTKGIGAVRELVAGTNSRLDQLIVDGRQRR
jgi:hypothetical protein